MGLREGSRVRDPPRVGGQGGRGRGGPLPTPAEPAPPPGPASLEEARGHLGAVTRGWRSRSLAVPTDSDKTLLVWELSSGPSAGRGLAPEPSQDGAGREKAAPSVTRSPGDWP